MGLNLRYTPGMISIEKKIFLEVILIVYINIKVREQTQV